MAGKMSSGLLLCLLSVVALAQAPELNPDPTVGEVEVYLGYPGQVFLDTHPELFGLPGEFPVTSEERAYDMQRRLCGEIVCDPATHGRPLRIYGTEPGLDDLRTIDRLSLWDHDPIPAKIDYLGMPDFTIRVPAGLPLSGGETLSFGFPSGTPETITFKHSLPPTPAPDFNVDIVWFSYPNVELNDPAPPPGGLACPEAEFWFALAARVGNPECMYVGEQSGQYGSASSFGYQTVGNYQFPAGGRLDRPAPPAMATADPCENSCDPPGSGLDNDKCSTILLQAKIDGWRLDFSSHWNPATTSWGLQSYEDSFLWLEGEIAGTPPPGSEIEFPLEFKVPLALIAPRAIGIPDSGASTAIDIDGMSADLATGNVHYEIPFFAAAGAGIPLGFSINYNSLLGNYHSGVARYVEWTSFWEEQGEDHRNYGPHRQEHNSKSGRIDRWSPMELGPGWSHTFDTRIRWRTRHANGSVLPHLELQAADGNLIVLEGRPHAGAYLQRIWVPEDFSSANSYMGSAVALNGMFLEFFPAGDCKYPAPSTCAQAPYDPCLYESWWQSSPTSPCDTPITTPADRGYFPGKAVLYFVDGTRYVFDCQGNLEGINIPEYNATGNTATAGLLSRTGTMAWKPDSSPAPRTLLASSEYKARAGGVTAPWIQHGDAGWTDQDNSHYDMWIERGVTVPAGVTAVAADAVHDSAGRTMYLLYEDIAVSEPIADTRRRLSQVRYWETTTEARTIEFAYVEQVVDGVGIPMLDSIAHETSGSVADWSFDYHAKTLMMSSKTIPGGRSIDIEYSNGAVGPDALWFKRTVDHGGSGGADKYDVSASYLYNLRSTSPSYLENHEKSLFVDYVDARGFTWTYEIQPEYARVWKVKSPQVDVPDGSGGTVPWTYESKVEWYCERTSFGHTRVPMVTHDSYRGKTHYSFNSSNTWNIPSESWDIEGAGLFQVLTRVLQYGVSGTVGMPSGAYSGATSGPTVDLEFVAPRQELAAYEYDGIDWFDIVSPTKTRAVFGLANCTLEVMPAKVTSTLLPQSDRTSLEDFTVDLAIASKRENYYSFTGTIQNPHRLYYTRVYANQLAGFSVGHSFEYDDQGRLIKETTDPSDPTFPATPPPVPNRGLATIYIASEYDEACGLPGRIQRPQYPTADEVTYNELGQVLSTISRPTGMVSTYTYGKGHFVESMVQSANEAGEPNASFTTERDSAYRVVRSTTGRSSSSAYTVLSGFDNLYRATSIHDPQGNTWNFSFDPHGNLKKKELATASFSGFGYEEEFVYDSMDRLICAAGPMVPATPAADPTGSISGRRACTVFARDPIGNVAELFEYELTGGGGAPLGIPSGQPYRESTFGYDTLYRHRFTLLPMVSGSAEAPLWIERRYTDENQLTAELVAAGGFTHSTGGPPLPVLPFEFHGGNVYGYDEALRPMNSGRFAARDILGQTYVIDPLEPFPDPSIASLGGVILTTQLLDGAGAVYEVLDGGTFTNQKFELDNANRVKGVYEVVGGALPIARIVYDDNALTTTAFEVPVGLTSPVTTLGGLTLQSGSAQVGKRGLTSEVGNRFGEFVGIKRTSIGEVKEQVYPHGAKSTRSIDDAGLVRSSSFEFANGGRTEVSKIDWNPLRQLEQLTDSRNHSTRYPSSGYGMSTAMEGPTAASGGGMLGHMEYVHDVFGRPSRSVEKNSGPDRITYFYHDVKDRLTKKIASTHPCVSSTSTITIEYTHDTVGNVKTITGGPIADYEMDYDSRGRVKRYEVTLKSPHPNLPVPPAPNGSGAWRHEFLFTYDDADRIRGVFGPIWSDSSDRGARGQADLPKGEAIIYEYELHRDLLSKMQYAALVKHPGDNFYTYDLAEVEFSYDQGRRLTKVKMSGCIELDYEYHANGSLARIHSTPSNPSLEDANGTEFTYDCQYTYDDDGRGLVTELCQEHLGLVTVYSYDDAGRLLTETVWQGDNCQKTTLLVREEYSYDLAGNRTRRTVDDGTNLSVYTYQYENDNTLRSETAVIRGGVTLSTPPIVFDGGSGPPAGCGDPDILDDDVTYASADDCTATYLTNPLALDQEVLPRLGNQAVTAAIILDGGSEQYIDSIDLWFPEIQWIGSGGYYGQQGYWHIEYVPQGGFFDPGDPTASTWLRAQIIGAAGGVIFAGDFDGDDQADGTSILSDGTQKLSIEFSAINTRALRVVATGGYLCPPQVVPGLPPPPVLLANRIGLTEIDLWHPLPPPSPPSVPGTRPEVGYTSTYAYDDQCDLLERTTTPADPMQQTITEEYCYDYQRLLSSYTRTQSGTTPTEVAFGISPTGQRLLKWALSGTSVDHVELTAWSGPSISANEMAVETFDPSGWATSARKSYFGAGLDGVSGSRDKAGDFRWSMTDLVGGVTTELLNANHCLPQSSGNPSPVPIDYFDTPLFGSSIHYPSGPQEAARVDATFTRRAFGQDWGDLVPLPSRWSPTASREKTMAGRWHDADTGLVYMRNRCYDPATGRFTQRDPILHGGGVNMYAYAGGNPVSHSDPMGLETTSLRRNDKGETEILYIPEIPADWSSLGFVDLNMGPTVLGTLNSGGKIEWNGDFAGHDSRGSLPQLHYEELQELVETIPTGTISNVSVDYANTHLLNTLWSKLRERGHPTAISLSDAAFALAASKANSDPAKEIEAGARDVLKAAARMYPPATVSLGVHEISNGEVVVGVLDLTCGAAGSVGMGVSLSGSRIVLGTGGSVARGAGRNLDELSAAGRVPAAGGRTRAGYVYQKHMGRKELPMVPGKELDQAGQDLLEGILFHPKTTVHSVTSGNAAGGTRFIGPNGIGATYGPDGSLAYFGLYK